jgi:hypothetical protein
MITCNQCKKQHYTIQGLIQGSSLRTVFHNLTYYTDQQNVDD